jgi:kinetochore protein Nuf2
MTIGHETDFSQSDKEIAGCISDIGVPFQPSDLQKPQPQVVQMVFEHLGELLLNATRDSIDPAMRAAAEDICIGDTEIIPFETRMLMGFFVSLRRMLVECGVHDFSFNDLARPTHERLVKIFSYIINFVRFRESQTNTIDENFNKADATKSRIETLHMDNEDMSERLDNMQRNRKAMEAAVKDKMKRNDELKARLLELKKGQERIAEQLEKAKSEKSRAQSMLEDRTERLIRVRQESEKLKPYVLESPSKLQDELQALSNNLVQERQQIDSLERRNRALQTSSDSFGIVNNEVQSCVKVLEEISVELQKEEEEETKAARNRDQVADRSNNVREIEQNEKMLQRQLEKWEERTDVLRKKHRERDETNRSRMDELRAIQKQLREERTDKGRDTDRRKVRIEQTEKKVSPYLTAFVSLTAC